MGYTHYYYVSPEFDKESFARVAADFKKLVTPLKHLGVILADGFGENHPIIRPDLIRFNGLAKCGHPKRDLGITTPSNNASGVCSNNATTTLQEITKSNWFAGAQLETRTCDGDCSHETFYLEQKYEASWTRSDGSVYTKDPIEESEQYYGGTSKRNPANIVGKYFDCTKTAYKPYDLAVTACLVIAKHYLGDDIVVRSDGEMNNWHEAMLLCDHFLGYGKKFSLDYDEEDGENDNSAFLRETWQ